MNIERYYVFWNAVFEEFDGFKKRGVLLRPAIGAAGDCPRYVAAGRSPSSAVEAAASNTRHSPRAPKLGFESAYLAFSCDCGGVERTHQCAGVLLQNVTVDILDRVTGPMIAGIVWAVSRTAEQAGLSL